MQKLKKTIKGFSMFVFIRIVTRITDFFLNVLVIRNMHSHLYALNFYYNIVFTIPILILKNTFKKICQSRQFSTSCNLNIVSFFDQMIIGIVTNLFIGFSFLIYYKVWSQIANQYFTQGLLIYILIIFLQSCIQLVIMRKIINFEYNLVIKSEIIAVFIKTIFGILVFNFSNLYLTALYFPITHLIYEITLFVLLFMSSLRQLLSQYKFHWIEFQVFKKLLRLFYLLMSKVILQQIPKKIVIDAAGYVLTSNLIGYIPRYLFNPLQQSLSNLLPTFPKQIFQKLISLIIKFELYFTFTICINIVIYSRNTLIFFYGYKYADSYIYFIINSILLINIGFNGIIQTAILSAKINPKKQSKNLYILCLIGLIVVQFLKAQTSSLIIFSITLNLCRSVIGYNAFMEQNNVQLKLNYMCLVVIIILSCLSYISASLIEYFIFELMIGSIFFLLSGLFVYWLQRHDINQLLQIIKQHKQ